MRNRQRGIALGQLVVWGFLLAVVAIMGMKTVPSVIEYYTIKKNIQALAGQAGQDTTVQELRVGFVRYMEIDAITSITHVPGAGFWTKTHSIELTVSSLPPVVDQTPVSSSSRRSNSPSSWPRAAAT